MRTDDHTICMTLRRYCLRGVFRFYPLQSLQPCMPSYHKAIRQALGGAYFSFHNSQRLQGKMVLGEDSYGHSGDKYFWPLSYSSAKTAQKRMDKLEKARIRCKLTGYNSGCIGFLGYTPETEALLEQERQEVIIAHQAWQEKQYLAI